MAHVASKGVVVVPMHGGKDLNPWTMKSILDQAGLTADELRDLLK